MAAQRRFALQKTPFLRLADGNRDTTTIMRDFMIALVPLMLFAWFKNGILPFINPNPALKTTFFEMIYPLLFMVIGALTTFLIEGIYFALVLKIQDRKELFQKLRLSYALIPGLLLGMLLPLYTPLWLLVVGSAFAVIIGKLIYGGFGHNIFNPALLGYLFVMVAYYGVILNNGGLLNSIEADALVSATPLTNFASNQFAGLDVLITPYGSIWDFFLGTVPGAMAETSALFILIGGVYLVVRRVISWRIPVIYIGSVFVLAYIIGAFNGYATNLNYALFHIFSGGLFFGAMFMATEPVTKPKTPNGEVLYALFLGVLTVLFRFVGSFPEGVASAIIIMNLFSLILDRISAKTRVETKRSKIVLTYAVFAVILLVISAYAVTKSIEPTTANEIVEVMTNGIY